MRHFKIVLLGICVLALSLGGAIAGLNPSDPGLGIRNNLSAICLDCHTVAPGGGTHYGSHFVYDPANPTVNSNSGGGGNWNYSGAARDLGQYYKTGQWTGSGASQQPYSKYGRTSDNLSISAANDNATYGAAAFVAANAAAYQGAEIICESCHNVVKNVGGGNNLVAPMTALTATQSAQVTPWQNTNEATLCVGCHGFMYAATADSGGTVNAANTGTYAGDGRNTSDFGGAKGNNGMHRINGVLYRQNHHVMTGDPINQTLATAGILWRDVISLPSDSVEAAVDTGSTKGAMPQLTTWNTDGGKIKSATATYFNCINCHSAPHSGLNGTSASILRDTDAGTITLSETRPAGAQHIYRIGEGSRTGGFLANYSDSKYCNDCHTFAVK